MQDPRFTEFVDVKWRAAFVAAELTKADIWFECQPICIPEWAWEFTVNSLCQNTLRRIVADAYDGHPLPQRTTDER